MLNIIDICNKYAWVILLNIKKSITTTNVFQKHLDASKKHFDESGCKQKIWVNQGSEFYNRSMKSWLHGNGIEMYLTHNEEKLAVAERFSEL